jgi:hypothetical protein
MREYSLSPRSDAPAVGLARRTVERGELLLGLLTQGGSRFATLSWATGDWVQPDCRSAWYWSFAAFPDSRRAHEILSFHILRIHAWRLSHSRPPNTLQNLRTSLKVIAVILSTSRFRFSLGLV